MYKTLSHYFRRVHDIRDILIARGFAQSEHIKFHMDVHKDYVFLHVWQGSDYTTLATQKFPLTALTTPAEIDEFDTVLDRAGAKALVTEGPEAKALNKLVEKLSALIEEVDAETNIGKDISNQLKEAIRKARSEVRDHLALCAPQLDEDSDNDASGG